MRRLLAAIVLLSACGGDADPEIKPTPIDPATAGSVRGKVLFKGEPPRRARVPLASDCAMHHAEPPLDEQVLVKDGRLQNAFVHVKEGLEKHDFDFPRTPVTMANAKCLYVPRVIGVQLHQPIRFTSEDSTDHNVHGFTSRGEFNFSLRGKGAEKTVKIRERDVGVRVKCDIHAWMVGWICAVPYPFFAVTGPDGAYEFKGLPPGEYVVEAWHETYGTQAGRVKLDPKGSVELDLTFSPK